MYNVGLIPVVFDVHFGDTNTFEMGIGLTVGMALALQHPELIRPLYDALPFGDEAKLAAELVAQSIYLAVTADLSATIKED